MLYENLRPNSTHQTPLYMGRLCLFLCLLWSSSFVQAHATFVFANVSLDPISPKVGERFEVTVVLEDPLQAPVEDAIVKIDVLNSEEVSILPLVTLQEEGEGVYRGGLELAEAGPVTFLFRDQTFPQEEARAKITVNIASPNPEGFQFIFPPTNVGSEARGIMSWLIWVIGLPILAGVVVTVLVLTQHSDEENPS